MSLILGFLGLFVFELGRGTRQTDGHTDTVDVSKYTGWSRFIFCKVKWQRFEGVVGKCYMFILQ